MFDFWLETGRPEGVPELAVTVAKFIMTPLD